jgi:hypothetical protein
MTKNVEIGTEATQFPEKVYINGIFVAVCLCRVKQQFEGTPGYGKPWKVPISQMVRVDLLKYALGEKAIRPNGDGLGSQCP